MSFRQSDWQLEDLDETISFLREQLKLQPAPHPDRSDSLSDLAIMLMARFEQLDQWEELDQAISLHQEALELQPTPHLDLSDTLINLADALTTQFEQSGQRKDLDDGISFLHVRRSNCSPHHILIGLTV